MTGPQFPPLFRGAAAADPLAAAIAAARAGTEAGLVTHDLAADRLRAAIVFAPETPLREAVIALPVCAVGFQNALGALAPPEVAVHLGWDGVLWLNGARCGGLTVHAATTRPEAVPDWLIIALDLALWPENDEGGLTPDQTALFAEGCSEVDAVALLEAWVRHSLVGLNTWEMDGVASLHREWTGLAHGINGPVALLGQTGHFLGIDEGFGLLLKQQHSTRLIPLTDLIGESS